MKDDTVKLRTIGAVAVFVVVILSPVVRGDPDPWDAEIWAHSRVMGGCGGNAWEVYHVGLKAAERGCLQQALSSLCAAVHLAPDVGRFHLTLGLVLMDMGRTEEAVHELELARSFGPASVVSTAHSALQKLGVDHHSVDVVLSDEPDTPERPAVAFDQWEKDRKEPAPSPSPDPFVSPEPPSPSPSASPAP
jgi:hypothetical protein